MASPGIKPRKRPNRGPKRSKQKALPLSDDNDGAEANDALSLADESGSPSQRGIKPKKLTKKQLRELSDREEAELAAAFAGQSLLSLSPEQSSPHSRRPHPTKGPSSRSKSKSPSPILSPVAVSAANQHGSPPAMSLPPPMVDVPSWSAHKVGQWAKKTLPPMLGGSEAAAVIAAQLAAQEIDGKRLLAYRGATELKNDADLSADVLTPANLAKLWKTVVNLRKQHQAEIRAQRESEGWVRAGSIAYGGHGEEWRNTDPRNRIGNNHMLRIKREQAALLRKQTSEPQSLLSGKSKKALLKEKRQQKEAARAAADVAEREATRESNALAQAATLATLQRLQSGGAGASESIQRNQSSMSEHAAPTCSEQKEATKVDSGNGTGHDLHADADNDDARTFVSSSEKESIGCDSGT